MIQSEENNEERRAYPRVPFRALARIWTESKVFDARTIDLSLGGASLVVETTEGEICPGDPCIVSYSMGDDAPARLELQASLVHVTGSTHGFLFQDLEGRTFQRLFRMILRSSGIETLLRQELRQFLRHRPR